MPVYSFTCPKCKFNDERVRAMKDSDKVCKCTECGAAMNRDFAADIPHAANDYKKPIHSDSLAISPSQRAEHEQHFPDIKLDNECRPIFDNFQAHDSYLKKTGFRKKRQRTKPKGVRIA